MSRTPLTVPKIKVQNINSSSILQEVRLTYFENIPAIQNSTPPL